MNSQQAKELLVLYRAGEADAHDPQLAEALSLARSDPELKHWFEQHCALQAAIREKFKQISVPQDLQAHLLAECARSRKIIRWRQPAVLAAAAAIVLLIGLAVFWSLPREEDRFLGFHSRMASTASRIYSMDLETNDLTQIRAFLANHNALSDYVLPPVLDKTPASGCKILTWNGNRVSMICFLSGKPRTVDVKSDLFLFVIDRSSLPDPPPQNKPLINKVNQLTTASWSLGDKVYVLGGFGDEVFIRKYL